MLLQSSIDDIQLVQVSGGSLLFKILVLKKKWKDLNLYHLHKLRPF